MYATWVFREKYSYEHRIDEIEKEEIGFFKKILLKYFFICHRYKSGRLEKEVSS